MPTMFDQKDIEKCFAVGCAQPPVYRVITLTEDGQVAGENAGGVSVSLLCRECLSKEHSLDDLGQPVLYGKRSVPGPVDIGILVIPLRLTKSQVGELREEITEQVPTRRPV